MLSTARLDYHVNLLGDCPFAPLQRPRGVVRKDIMGALTPSLHIAHSMFDAGVPVWVMRTPQQITTEDTIMGWVFPTPAPPMNEASNLLSRRIYKGYAGDAHLLTISRYSCGYVDLEVYAIPEELTNPALAAYAPFPGEAGPSLVSRTQPANRHARYGPCKCSNSSLHALLIDYVQTLKGPSPLERR